jgi:SulP family sulfate permease
MLAQAAAGLAAHGGVLALCGARHSPAGERLGEYLGKVGLLSDADSVRRFDDLDAALAWAEERVLARGRGASGPERALNLAEMEVLAGLAPADLAALERVAEPRSHPAGATLFKRGERGDEMFFVRRGRVRIAAALERGGSLHVATFQRGDFFGDLAFLDAQARSADARAETDVEVYALSRRVLDQAAAAQPALGARLFEGLGRVLAARLRATDEEIRALSEE